MSLLLIIARYQYKFQSLGDNLVSYAKSQGIVVLAYSPLSAYPFMMTPAEDPVVKSIAHTHVTGEWCVVLWVFSLCCLFWVLDLC